MDVPIFRLDRYTLPQAHILPNRAAVELEITRGRVQQRVRAVRSKVFLIGAANDCDLVLGDLQFPEAYAYLFVNGHEVSIRRLGSGPGLLVCGEPADTAELFHLDGRWERPRQLRACAANHLPCCAFVQRIKVGLCIFPTGKAMNRGWIRQRSDC